MEISSSQKNNKQDIDNEKELGDTGEIKSSYVSSDIVQQISQFEMSQGQSTLKLTTEVEVDLKLYIGHDIYRKKQKINNYDQLQQITYQLIKNHHTKVDGKVQIRYIDSEKDHINIFDNESLQTAIDDVNNLNSHPQHILKLYAELITVSDPKLPNLTLSYSSYHKQSTTCQSCNYQKRNHSQNNLFHHDPYNSFEISQNQQFSQNMLNSFNQFQNTNNMSGSLFSQNESGIYNGEEDKHKDHEKQQRNQIHSSELENQNKVNNYNQSLSQQMNQKFYTQNSDLHNNSFHTPQRKNEQDLKQFNKNYIPFLPPYKIMNQFDANYQQFLLLKEYFQNYPNNTFNQSQPNNIDQEMKRLNSYLYHQYNKNMMNQNITKQPSFNEIEKLQLNQHLNQQQYTSSQNHQHQRLNNRADTECLTTKSYNQDDNNAQAVKYRHHNSLDDVFNIQKLTSQFDSQSAKQNDLYQSNMYNYHNNGNIVMSNQINNNVQSIIHQDSIQNNLINNQANNNINKSYNNSIYQENSLKDANQEVLSNYSLNNDNNSKQTNSSPRKNGNQFEQNQPDTKNSLNKLQQSQPQKIQMSNENPISKSSISETFKIESLLNYSIQFNNQKDLFCSDDLIDQSIVVQKPKEEIKIQNYPQYLQTLKQIQKKTVEDLKKDHKNPQCVMEILSSEKCKFCMKNLICKYKDKQKLILTIINYKIKQMLPYIRPLIQKQIDTSKKHKLLTNKNHILSSINSQTYEQSDPQINEKVSKSQEQVIDIQSKNKNKQIEQDQIQNQHINQNYNSPIKVQQLSSHEQSLIQDSDQKQSENKNFKDISFSNFNDHSNNSNNLIHQTEVNEISQKQHTNFDQNKNLLMPQSNNEQQDLQKFHSFNDFPDESHSLFQSFDFNQNLEKQQQNQQQLYKQFKNIEKEDENILKNQKLDLKHEFSVYSNDQSSNNKNEQQQQQQLQQQQQQINQQSQQQRNQNKQENSQYHHSDKQFYKNQNLHYNKYSNEQNQNYQNKKQYENDNNHNNKRQSSNQKQSRFYNENQQDKYNNNNNQDNQNNTIFKERSQKKRNSLLKQKNNKQFFQKVNNLQDEVYEAIGDEFQICSSNSSFSDEIEESKDQKSDQQKIKGSNGAFENDAKSKEYSQYYNMEISQNCQNQIIKCLPGEKRDILIELKNTGKKNWDKKNFYLKCIKGMYQNYKFSPLQKIYSGQQGEIHIQIKIPQDIDNYKTSWRLFETKSKKIDTEIAFGNVLKLEFQVQQAEQVNEKFWSELKTQLTQLLDMDDKTVKQKVNDFIKNQQSFYNNSEINKYGSEQLISHLINNYFDT